jgi:hypothetical protein
MNMDKFTPEDKFEQIPTSDMVPENTIVRENWLELRNILKNHWNKLDDRDIERIGGSRDKLIDVLQSRYGCGKEEAERQVTEFLNSEEFLGRRHPVQEKMPHAKPEPGMVGEGTEGHFRLPMTPEGATDPFEHAESNNDYHRPVEEYQKPFRR